jgi:hypothetical protein
MTEPTLEKMVCYNHPDRETYLRCNRCNRPICSECAVLTPTGYRCKECVRGQQKVFETAHSLDPLVGFVIAAVVGFLGSYVAGIMGFFIIFIAPLIGLGITEVIRYAVKRRRSRLLFQVSTAGAVIGSLPILVSIVLVTLSRGNLSLGLLVPLLWQGLYTFLIGSTVYYRLSGIQL